MKLYVVSIILVFFAGQVFATSSPSPALGASSFFIGNQIKSYKEWKSEKVHAALTQTQTTRTQILKAKSEGKSSQAESLEKLEKQQQWNMEVANDLSVADYFVLYLSQQNQSDRFHEAAKKMTSSEVAELMEAYAATLAQGTPGEKLPAQATQVGDQIK